MQSFRRITHDVSVGLPMETLPMTQEDETQEEQTPLGRLQEAKSKGILVCPEVFAQLKQQYHLREHPPAARSRSCSRSPAPCVSA